MCDKTRSWEFSNFFQTRKLEGLEEEQKILAVMFMYFSYHAQ